MCEHKPLTPIELYTLRGLADKIGLQRLADHTGLPPHTLDHAIDQGAEGVPHEHHAAITEFLRAHM